MAKAIHFRIKSKLGLAAYYRPGINDERLAKLSHTMRSIMSLPCLKEQDIKLELIRLRQELKEARVTREVKTKLEKLYR